MVSISEADLDDDLDPGPVGPQHGALDFAALAVNADWWPRGLGLQLDQDESRHQFEPKEGARTWLQLAQRDGGWISPHGPANARPQTFLKQLRVELSDQQRGVSDRARSRLPDTSMDMQASLEALDQSAMPRGLHRTMACPTFGHFSPTEELSGRVPIQAEGRRPGIPARLRSPDADLQQIKSEVARRIGATLLERFDWERPVVLRADAFQRLAESMASQPAPQSWSLRVGLDGGGVELMAHDAHGEQSMGVVLDRGPHLAGAMVFRPNVSDDLESMWQRMGAGYNGTARTVGRVMVPKHAVADPRKPLADVHPQGRVIVAAHGRPGIGRDLPRVAGFTPKELAAQLIKEGLPKHFAGTVFLHACSSGNGLGHTEGFSHQLQSALAAKGYKYLSVAGRPGVTRGILGGATLAPSEVVLNGEATIRRTEELIRNLRHAQQEGNLGESRSYERLIKKETRYRDRVAKIRTEAELSRQAEQIKHSASPTVPNSPALLKESAKPSLHTRLWNGLKRLFERDAPKVRVGVDAHAPRAFDKTTLDIAGVRGMWGHVGSKDTSKDASKKQR